MASIRRWWHRRAHGWLIFVGVSSLNQNQHFGEATQKPRQRLLPFESSDKTSNFKPFGRPANNFNFLSSARFGLMQAMQQFNLEFQASPGLAIVRRQRMVQSKSLPHQRGRQKGLLVKDRDWE